MLFEPQFPVAVDPNEDYVFCLQGKLMTSKVDVDAEFKEVKQLMEDDADQEIDELKVGSSILFRSSHRDPHSLLLCPHAHTGHVRRSAGRRAQDDAEAQGPERAHEAQFLVSHFRLFSQSCVVDTHGLVWCWGDAGRSVRTSTITWRRSSRRRTSRSKSMARSVANQACSLQPESDLLDLAFQIDLTEKQIKSYQKEMKERDETIDDRVRFPFQFC